MAELPFNPLHAARFPILRRLIRRAGATILRNFEARAARRRVARRIARLDGLDDRALRDIGLTRADLDSALNDPESPDKALRRATLTNRKADLERPRLRAR